MMLHHKKRLLMEDIVLAQWQVNFAKKIEAKRMIITHFSAKYHGKHEKEPLTVKDLLVEAQRDYTTLHDKQSERKGGVIEIPCIAIFQGIFKLSFFYLFIF